MKFQKILIFISIAVYFIVAIYVFNSLKYKNIFTVENKIKNIFKIDKIFLSNKDYEYKTEPSFNGDGNHIVIFNLKIDDFNKCKNNKFQNLFSDDKELIYNFESKMKEYFPSNDGYYSLYDKQDNKFKTIEEYFDFTEFKSLNYILLIYDLNNEKLIYYEYDS